MENRGSKNSMLALTCAICGEPSTPEDQACPFCESDELRAVADEQIPETAQDRLVAEAHRTVEKINDLHTDRAHRLDEDSKARIERALRHRAEGQVSVIEARLRSEQSRLRREQEELDTALYHATLDRLKRELQTLL